MLHRNIGRRIASWAARDRKLVHRAAALADSPIELRYPFKVALS
jgi:hypothetical protein